MDKKSVTWTVLYEIVCCGIIHDRGKKLSDGGVRLECDECVFTTPAESHSVPVSKREWFHNDTVPDYVEDRRAQAEHYEEKRHFWEKLNVVKRIGERFPAAEQRFCDTFALKPALFYLVVCLEQIIRLSYVSRTNKVMDATVHSKQMQFMQDANHCRCFFKIRFNFSWKKVGNPPVVEIRPENQGIVSSVAYTALQEINDIVKGS